MRDKLDQECFDVEQDCLYTSEAHHIISAKHKLRGNLFQIVPAVLAASLGALSGAGVWPALTLAGSVVSAAVAAVSNVLNPFAEYNNHLKAAKGFTLLKQDAKALRQTFSASMGDEAYVTAAKALRDRYADLVRSSPETDKKSFEEGRRRIQQERVHDHERLQALEATNDGGRGQLDAR